MIVPRWDIDNPFICKFSCITQGTAI